jgi:hypothetical protein
MKTIWKFRIGLADKQVVLMPVNSKILHVAVQHGKICLWAEVSDAENRELRTIAIYGTGHTLPDNTGRYIGTFLMHDDTLVFHAYDEG